MANPTDPTLPDLSDFVLEDAYVALREQGESEKQAVRNIAQYLSDEADLDLTAAKEGGYTEEEIIATLIGRDPDDIRPSLLRTFGRGVAEGAISEGTAAATGVGIYKGAGLAGNFLLRSANLVPPAGPYGLLAKAGLATLGAGLVAASGLGEDVAEEVLGERQALPSELGAQRTGEVIGGTAAYIYPSRKLLQKIPETPDFGSKLLMQRHRAARNDRLKDKDVAPEEIERLSRTPISVKGTQVLEKVLAASGREARQTKPFGASAGEVSAAIVPALVEGIVIDMSPGSDTMATLSGLGAAVLDPTRVARTAVADAAGAVRREGPVGAVKKGVTKVTGAIQEKRQRMAREHLIKALEEAGQDPDLFVLELDAAIAEGAALDSTLPVGERANLADILTPGQLTNNPVVLLAEKIFSQGRQDIPQVQKDAAIAGAGQMAKLIEVLTQTGSRDALRVAADLQQDNFDKQLVGLLDTYLYKAAGAADRLIKARGPETGAEDGAEMLKEAAGKALKEARDFENTLYNKLDGNILIDTTPILRAFDNLQKIPEDGGVAVLGSADKIPDTLRDYLRDFGYRFGEALDTEISDTDTLSNVVAFRRYLQRQVRGLETASEPFNRAIFGPLDQAALEAFGIKGNQDFMTPNSVALRNAYDFSNSLNNTFLRSFAGDLTKKQRGLRDRILPEEALDTVFKPSEIRQRRNLRSLEESFGLVDEVAGTNFKGTLNSALDFYLRKRFAALEADRAALDANPNTPPQPLIDQKELQALIDDQDIAFQVLDDEFGISSDLANVERAQVMIESALSTQSQRAKTNNQQNVLASFIGGENAQDALRQILRGENAPSRLRRLGTELRQVARSPRGDMTAGELKEGLFATLLDEAITESSTNGNIDFKKLYTVLFDTSNYKPFRKGFRRKGASVMRLLNQNNLVDNETFTKLRDFTERGRDLQVQLERGIDDMFATPENDALKDLIARFGGAQGIAFVARRLGFTPTIQTTGAGAQFVKNQFLNVPNAAIRDILIDVTRPGQASVLADFLRKGATDDDLRNLNAVYRYISKFLLGSPAYATGAAFRIVREEADEPIAELPPPPAPSAVPMQQPQAMAPFPTQLPPPPPQGVPNPQQRQQFAALFPNDPLSGLIQQQGIASLPQSPG